MGLELLSTDWSPYVPEYGGNRARAESGEDPHPTVVHLRCLTWAEYQERVARVATLSDADLRADFLRTMVGPIEYLTLPGGAVATTGADLVPWADRLDGRFFLELETAAVSASRLSAGLKKNLNWPPGLPASPPSASGIAGTAGVEVSMCPPSGTVTATPDGPVT